MVWLPHSAFGRGLRRGYQDACEDLLPFSVRREEEARRIKIV